MTNPRSRIIPLADLVAQRRELLVATHRYLSSVARAVGLGTSDFVALLCLAAGDMTAKELGGVLRFTTASITVLSDRLTAAGLVVRKPHPTDRRRILLALTPKGRRVARRIDQVVTREVEGAAQAVPEAQWPSLLKFMAALAEHQLAIAEEAAVPGGAAR
jgi:DNA-binding MarR family transcriptional regulator